MKRIFEYFSTNRMLVPMLVIMILLFGIFRLFSVKQEVTPSVETDRLIVSISYPNASPVDVENDVVIPLEEKLKAITGIDNYKAVIFENSAMITVELEENLRDIRSVKDEVIRQMNNVADLPSEVDVTVTEMNPKLMSVYTVGLKVKEGKTATTKELYNYAEWLHDELLRKVDDVAEINMNGYQDPEVHIYVNPTKMAHYYISLNEIVNSIKNRNVRTTGGKIKMNGSESTVITIGEFKSIDEVKNVIIRSSFDNKRVCVKDISHIEDGYEDSDVLVRVDRTPSVILSIVKKENSDVVKTIENVKKYIKRIEKSIPQNLEIVEIQDNSRSIRSLVKVAQSNAILGAILVFITLMVFMDKRSAIWVAFGIIITVLATISYMSYTDISFNMISLVAIVTVLGMIVDNGIVVSENIYAYRLKGLSLLNAVVQGTSDVLGPIASSTFTTVAAFFPMLNMSGMMGKFTRQFPIIVIFSLLFSFIQAIFILPNMIYSTSLKLEKKRKSKEKEWYNKIAEKFAGLLRFFLRYRYIVFTFFVVLLIISLMVTMSSMRGFRLAPSEASDTIRIKLKTPEDTSLEKTSLETFAIEDVVLNVVNSNELIAEQTMVGKQLSGRDIGAEIHQNWAQVTAYLVPATERKRTAKEIIENIRQEIKRRNISGFESIVVEEAKFGPDAGKPVEIKLASKDSEMLGKAVKDVKSFLANIKGVVNIDDDQNIGRREIVVVPKYEVLSRYNLDVATLAQTVRTAFGGSIASSILRETESVNFRVELSPEFKTNIYVLENLLVPNSSGRLIRLKDIAILINQISTGTIRHYNGERTITVEADLEPDSRITPQFVMQKIIESYGNIGAKYRGVSLLFGGEIEETMKSLRELAVVSLIALLAIYLVLVLQFNHFVQPFIVLGIIPFGLIGAILALKLHGMPLSFMGIIGIIGLAGVVVNNGIVMVDLINRIIGGGNELSREEIKEKIVIGTKMRLRPILLTSITTIVGLLPTVYGIGGSSDMVTPVVTVLAYGLLLATVLTLILLPCILMISVDLGLLKFNHKVEAKSLRNSPAS